MPFIELELEVALKSEASSSLSTATPTMSSETVTVTKEELGVRMTRSSWTPATTTATATATETEDKAHDQQHRQQVDSTVQQQSSAEEGVAPDILESAEPEKAQDDLLNEQQQQLIASLEVQVARHDARFAALEMTHAFVAACSGCSKQA